MSNLKSTTINGEHIRFYKLEDHERSVTMEFPNREPVVFEVQSRLKKYGVKKNPDIWDVSLKIKDKPYVFETEYKTGIGFRKSNAFSSIYRQFDGFPVEPKPDAILFSFAEELSTFLTLSSEDGVALDELQDMGYLKPSDAMKILNILKKTKDSIGKLIGQNGVSNDDFIAFARELEALRPLRIHFDKSNIADEIDGVRPIEYSVQLPVRPFKDMLMTAILKVKISQNKQNALSIDGEIVPPKSALRLSMTADIAIKDTSPSARWESRSSGQNYETLKEIYHDDKAIMDMLEIWRQYHLNDMVAGSRRQIAYLEEHRKEKEDTSIYSEDCEILKKGNLLIDENMKTDKYPDGYQYGHAWLFRKIPNEVLLDLLTLTQKDIPALSAENEKKFKI